MAITQAMCTSFKIELLNGTFDFGSGTTQEFYIALYTDSASLDATTSVYTTTNEVVGTGYTAYGKKLTVSQVPTNGGSGTTAYLDFADITWTSATITARGAMIYLKDNATNPAIAILDFGANKSSSAGDFTIQFPTADASSAIIRIG